MDTKEVPNGAAAAEKPLLDGIEALTELYTSGIERMGEVQKKGLEIALQHNVDVVNTYKKMLPLAPGLVMLDLTRLRRVLPECQMRPRSAERRSSDASGI